MNSANNFRLYCVSVIIAGMFSAELAFADGNIIEIPLQQVQEVLEKKPAVAHPRLFLTDQELPEVMQRINAGDDLKAFHRAVIEQADAIIGKPPLRRTLEGHRLLRVSRDAVKRLLILSWSYRSTGREVYLKRAEQEMLAIAAFFDWNPIHFLDVAEMTTAMAVGYDWCYHGLPEKTRAVIREAIVEKGLRPSLDETLKSNNWIHRDNNWNQVCHGGMVCGGLAVMEDEPAMAEKIIHRAVNKIQIAMNEYEPDGAYPEGPGYWSYGTTYNVLMLAAMDSVLGTDFGLSKKNGFAKSANYFLHVTGPTGLYFNYPDSKSEFTFKPVVFWFAKTYNQPALAWSMRKLWDEAMEHDVSDLMRERTSVLALMWASSSETSRPKALSWMGQGVNPVALFRTSWDEDAVFLGFKGGTPQSNHGHMDIGSFVLDAEGVRWAVDLGPESYYKIESRGISLWDRKQGGSRWKIFRYNNFSHNTLTVNQKLQRVDGFAPIIRYSGERGFAHAVVDMTEVYQGQLATALRGAGIVESETIVIQDELQAADSAATVRWSMVTPATVEIVSDNSALLKQKGKVLQFRVVSDADVKLGTFSTEPRADYDAQNPGTRMIGFDVQLEPGQHQTVRVMMATGTEEGPLDTNLKNVEAWSEPLE